ncbi:OmpA family protein [Lacinutrix chionoecetis]
MSKKTNYLIGILLTIIIGTILYYYFCCKPCMETANKEAEIENIVTEPEAKATTINTFSVLDSKSSLKLSANDNFNFKVSEYSILEPVSDQLNGVVDRLATYLNDNKGKQVNITGYYTSEENNSSAFPNLGMARANAVKNYFVSHGIASKSINTYGELNDDLVPDENNVHLGPVLYSINTVDANDTSMADELKALRENIKANPLMLYFDSGAASINLTAEQREKVAEMSRYVDKTDNASIQIIGHTDNTGNRVTNTNLGKNRADFAKNYLVQNGISTEKIKTSSKGPDAPIADNATEEGRAKNRRVEVTLN